MLFQDEIHQLRHHWAKESVERQRMAADVVQLRTDLGETAENHKRCLKDVANVSAEVMEYPIQKYDKETSLKKETLANIQNTDRFNQ